MFYPLYDQFLAFDGTIERSTHRGFVQTFVDLAPDAVGGGEVAQGSTKAVDISSEIDPQAGGDPENVERGFPIVRSGQQLLLVVTSAVVVGWAIARIPPDEGLSVTRRSLAIESA